MQKITKPIAILLSAIILACTFSFFGCGDDLDGFSSNRSCLYNDKNAAAVS